MSPKYHVIYGFIFSLILWLIFPEIGVLGFSLTFLSSVFIDLDHAVRYSIKTGNFNPIKFWKWSKKEELSGEEIRECQYPQFIFHGVEFVVVLAILAFYFSFVKFILIGVVFHLILDYIWLINKGQPMGIKLSQVYVYRRNLRCPPRKPVKKQPRKKLPRQAK